jgi:hypothetical protein
LIKDYNLEVHYHLGKANFIADALSHKLHAKPLLEEGLHHVVLHNIMVSCSLESHITELQKTNPGIFHIKSKMKEQDTKHFRVYEKGVLWFDDRLVVPKDCELQNKILEEAHSSKLSIQPGRSKMY